MFVMINSLQAARSCYWGNDWRLKSARSAFNFSNDGMWIYIMCPAS
jgi:hypothetical protein